MSFEFTHKVKVSICQRVLSDIINKRPGKAFDAAFGERAKGHGRFESLLKATS